MRLQSLLGRKDGRPKTPLSRNLRPSCRGAPLEMCLCPDPLQFPFQTERKRHSACEPIFRRRPACLLPASPPRLASSSSGATHKSFQSQALPPLSLLLSLSTPPASPAVPPRLTVPTSEMCIIAFKCKSLGYARRNRAIYFLSKATLLPICRAANNRFQASTTLSSRLLACIKGRRDILYFCQLSTRHRTHARRMVWHFPRNK